VGASLTLSLWATLPDTLATQCHPRQQEAPTNRQGLPRLLVGC